jgi:hypothetical protein
MVDHPAARALTGYLLVRGGVHQIAYARAIENLTGANLTRMFPTPRIATEKIPECRPHIERSDHLRLYRFSPEDYHELAAVFNGPIRKRAKTWRSSTSHRRERFPTTCPRSRPSSHPTTNPRRSPRSPRSCGRKQACRRSRLAWSRILRSRPSVQPERPLRARSRAPAKKLATIIRGKGRRLLPDVFLRAPTARVETN